MILRSLGLFVKKLKLKVGLAGYDILLAYFLMEALSKKKFPDTFLFYSFVIQSSHSKVYTLIYLKMYVFQISPLLCT